MEVSVLNINGQETGRKVQLNDAIFGIEPNEYAVHATVKNYLANQRQGTQSAKTRSEVRGGGRKPFRQKGTGRHRQGSSTDPSQVGGGIVFAPKPRSYRYTLPKKMRRLAMLSVLSSKVKENEIIVMDEIKFEAPKTKTFVETLNNLKVADKKVLFVLPGADKNVYLSARNIQNAKVAIASDINTYGVLNAASMVVTESALSAIESVLNK